MPDEQLVALSRLTIDAESGVLFHSGIPVGRVEDGVLILNLGWMKLAKLGVKVQADPDVDTKRGGVVFERQHG